MDLKARSLSVRKSVFLVFLILIFFSSSLSFASPGENNLENTCRKLTSMARVYMAYGDYVKAEPLAEQSLSTAQKGGVSDVQLSNCLNDLSCVYLETGRLEEAEELCSLAVELQKEAYYDDHPYVAYTIKNLSRILRAGGKYAKADLAIEEAMRIILENHTETDHTFAPFLAEKARLLSMRGHYKESQYRYLKSLKLIRASYGPDHLYTAQIEGDFAEMYTHWGKYSKAEPLIERSIAVQQKTFGQEHHKIANAWLTQACIYGAKGLVKAQEELIQRAKKAVEKSGNPSAVSEILKRISSIRDSDRFAMVLNKNAR